MGFRLPSWGGVVAVAALILGACSSHPATPKSNPASPQSVARPYVLVTHCGIDEARIGGRYFEAMHPLSDGQGNPPPGWGNPVQRGTMRLLSRTEALFQDDKGHHVLFRLRPGATGFKHLCS